jgi:hypothetical protein
MSSRRSHCAALIAIAIVLAVPDAAAMQMQVAGDQIILSGPVRKRDDHRLIALLDKNAGITTIILRNSHGGDALAGYALGALIRARGLRTAVSGFCNAACSRLFLGGVERQFTDEQPVDQTHVAFHGSYRSDGRLIPDAADRMRAFIIKYSDGKADPALVERWIHIPNRKGFIYFFDSARLKRADGVSVFLCSGEETKDNRFEQCEKLPGRTGYALGIFTSPALVKVNR